MSIQHEIISFNPTTGSILVRYFNAEVPEGLIYNIDIPLENGAFISQDRIDALIEHYKPVGQLDRAAALKSAAIPDALAALIPQPVDAPVVTA